MARNRVSPRLLDGSLTRPSFIYLGEVFAGSASITNLQATPIACEVTISVSVFSYDGQSLGEIERVSSQVTLAPGSVARLPFAAGPEAYLGRVDDSRYLSASLTVWVPAVEWVMVDAPGDTIVLPEPVEVQVGRGSQIYEGESTTVTCTWTNHLPARLTGASLKLVSSVSIQLGEGSEITFPLGTLLPGEGFALVTNLVGLREGQQMVIASLTSDRISGIVGHTYVGVYPPLRVQPSLQPGVLLRLEFLALKNRAYRVESIGALRGAAWQPAGSDISGEGRLVAVDNPIGTGLRQRFFRVRVVP